MKPDALTYPHYNRTCVNLPREPARRYLTLEEFSVLTGLSASTIHRLRKKGAVPYLQPGGPVTRILFPPDALEAAAPPVDTPASSEPPTEPPSVPLRGPVPAWRR